VVKQRKNSSGGHKKLENYIRAGEKRAEEALQKKKHVHISAAIF
jgi:hypothetical protein